MTSLDQRRLYATLIISIFVFSMTALSAVAQTTGSATLRGTIKDPQGAIIRGATVTLTNERTKDERSAKSSEDGTYTFAAVAPGTYTMKAEASGFKVSQQAGLTIETSGTQGIDITMEVGQPTETVTITAGAEQLQTETGAKEQTITAKQIDNLSIISRSSLELLRILPGVVAPDNTSLESISFGGGANANANYHVNGLRGEQNNVTIDGSRMIDIGSNNGTVITANPDMVQEVKVQTSNYAAEHGTSAVQISATTKGGGSGFHGSVYDYMRHWRFQANDRSNSINSTPGNIIDRPKSKYNYPGGNIGGPVLLPWTNFNKNRDKLFFFVGFELYRQQVDEGSKLLRVPTLKERTGDFSETTGIFSDPGPDGIAGNSDDIPLPGVRVPAGCNAGGLVAGTRALNVSPCVHPLGRALLNLFPAPNRTVPFGQNNYVYSVLRPNDRNQFTSRFDYSISEKTKMYVRFAREYEEQGFPRGLWWDSSAYELPGKLTSKNLGRSIVVNLTNILNSSTTNEILFSASKLKLNYDFAEPDKVSWTGLGLTPVGFFSTSNPNIPASLQNKNPYVPLSVITWGQGDFHTAYGYPILAWNDSFAITDNLVKVQNTHTLKFGAFVEQANKRQQSNADTNIVTAQWGQTTGTGTNFGDVFVGKPIEFTQATTRPIDNFRYYNYEFYAQDSWKMRPNLTFEYGMRAAYLPQNFERKGLGVLFDPASYVRGAGPFINGDRTRPNGYKLAARDEIPKGVLPNLPVQWMPRFNVAWDVGGKGDLVIRAGAGLFYNRVQGNYDYYSSGEMPNTYSSTVDTPWASANGLSFGDLTTLNPFTSNVGAINVNSRDIQSNEIPRVANMSFTIEKRLPMNNILAVAYVGTQGRHLPQRRNANIIPLGRLLNGTLPLNGSVSVDNPDGPSTPTRSFTSINLADPAQRGVLAAGVLRGFRPFDAFNSVGLFQFTGTSTYHSLQATLSHNGRNLQYFATYTFAKALGTVATAESDGAAWADPIDTRNRSWGVLPFDRTHVFNLSYNWTVPKLARGGFSNGFTDAVFNGWQVSGITTVQSGTPLRLRFTGALAQTAQAVAWYGSDAFNGTNAGASIGAITPIYLGNPALGGTATGSKIYDISKLAIPSFGNTGPSQPPFYIRTPGRSNFDISFFKNFNITEEKKIQFRTGLFNIFNQAYPTQLNVTSTNPADSDIYLALDTECDPKNVVRRPTGDGGNVAGICDPTKPFRFTQRTLDNFGKIQTKRGRRIVEFALKFYF
jgi:hypothetical protein